MKTKVIAIAVLLSVSTFISCSPKDQKHESSPPQSKPQGVLTEGQKQTLKKADEAENILDETHKSRMKDADEVPAE